MDEELMQLESAVSRKQIGSATIKLALNQIKVQPAAIVLRVIMAFKQDQRVFDFLCLKLLLLNRPFPMDIMRQLANFASGNTLSLFSSLLHAFTYLLAAPSPTDKNVTEFKCLLNRQGDYASFVSNAEGFTFGEFKANRLQVLAGWVLYDSAFVTEKDIFCDYMNMFNALETALSKRALLDDELYPLCTGVGYSQTCARIFCSASCRYDAKQYLSTIYSILVLRAPLENLIHLGPLVGFSEECANAGVVSALIKKLPDPGVFTACVVRVYQELSLSFAKTVVVEFLSLWMYRYYCALVYGGAEEPVAHYAATNIFGFLLNLKSYSSIGAAVQLCTLQLLLLTYFRGGDFLNIIFTLRKLQQLQILSISELDRASIDFCDLTTLAAMLLLNQQQIQANASHIERLYDFSGALARARDCAVYVRRSANPLINMYFLLICAEISCFADRTLYGDIFHVADAETVQLLKWLFGVQNSSQMCLKLLKEVYSIVHAQRIQSNSLAQRFKLIEYMLAGQIGKAIEANAIRLPMRQAVTLYVRPLASWTFGIAATHYTVVSINRAFLTRLDPAETSFMLARELDCEEYDVVKIMLSDASLRRGTLLFLQCGHTVAKIPYSVAKIKITIKAKSWVQPENVKLELQALQALANGELIQFVCLRFRSLMSSLHYVLNSRIQNQIEAPDTTSETTESLQVLEGYFAAFYRALPILLFGPFCGLPVASQAAVAVTEDQMSELCNRTCAASYSILEHCGVRTDVTTILKLVMLEYCNDSNATLQDIQKQLAIACIKPTFVPFEVLENEKPAKPSVQTYALNHQRKPIRVAIDPMLYQLPIEKTAAFPAAIRFLGGKMATQIAASQTPAETDKMPNRSAHESMSPCETRAFYYVDPSLAQTQEKLRAVLDAVKPAWEQISDPEELIGNITNADKFLYAGHGGGENLLPRHRLCTLYRLPEAAVLGCASMCGLTTFGGAIRYQPHKAWAKSEFLIGCLWDMLGSELDRFAVVWARTGGYAGFCAGLSAMRWTYCMAMGIVAWG